MAKSEQQVVLFEKLVRAGFDPIRDMIEYGSLEEQLTAQDIAKITHAIEGGLNNWCNFLRMARKQARDGKDIG